MAMKKRGLKNVDLRNKITSRQYSWIKRLFEDDFHDWKIIPLFLIGKYLGENFKFHNNIDMNNDTLSKFQSFYQDIFIKWINNCTAKPTLSSMILSEFIWFYSNTIFNMYIYNARTTGYLNISHLLIYIKGIKDTEKKLCENDAKRRKNFNKKWKNVLIN